MAKGGQGKGKAKGHSKTAPSYSPPSSITYPSSTKRTVRTSSPRISNKVSYGQGELYAYTKEGKLIKKQDRSRIIRRRVNMTTAYCMKCRKKVEIVSPKQVTMKNGRPAMQGTCPVCGTKVFRIGK